MFKTREALWERIVREKDRQIEILAEQVDYLRMQLAMAGRALPAGSAVNPSEQLARPSIEVRPYISDDELDAQALLEAGRVTQEQLPDVLESLGFTGDLSLDIPPLG